MLLLELNAVARLSCIIFAFAYARLLLHLVHDIKSFGETEMELKHTIESRVFIVYCVKPCHRFERMFSFALCETAKCDYTTNLCFIYHIEPVKKCRRSGTKRENRFIIRTERVSIHKILRARIRSCHGGLCFWFVLVSACVRVCVCHFGWRDLWW